MTVTSGADPAADDGGPGPAPGPPVPRWLGGMFLLLAALMVPWIAVLWFRLPERDTAAHYRLAWIGFDILLAIALIRTGWVAWKGRDHVELPAVAAATLLVVDAWFDVLTASHRSAVVAAVAGALLVELPLAAVCLWIARHAEQVRRERLHWALRVHPSEARRLGSPP